MADLDASTYAGDLLGWRSELAARVRDSLARRGGSSLPAVPLSTGLRAIAKRLENAASLAGLKSGLRELLAHFRRPAPAAAPSAAEAELRAEAALHARIRAHGAHESIEGYCAYLFSVPVSL